MSTTSGPVSGRLQRRIALKEYMRNSLANRVGDLSVVIRSQRFRIPAFFLTKSSDGVGSNTHFCEIS